LRCSGGAVGQRRLHGRAGLEGAEDLHGCDRGAGDFRRDIAGDGGEAENLDVERCPGIAGRLEILPCVVGQPAQAKAALLADQTKRSQSKAAGLFATGAQLRETPMPEVIRPAFVQTFATTIVPNITELPELILVSLRLDPSVDVDLITIENLAHDFSERKDGDEAPELRVRGFTEGNSELVIRTIATQLRDGATGRLPVSMLPAIESLAEAIYRDADVPVVSSPLKGVTLSNLVAGAGSVSVVQIFHSGVTPAEATGSVLFIAGTMIILGAANAVRRAIEAGLEQKLLKVLGFTQEVKDFGRLRDSNSRQKRTKTRTTQAQPAMAERRGERAKHS
jgi:hypothetical protein